MSIEGIALENFTAFPKADINSTTPSHQPRAVLHSFYLMIANRMLPLLLHTANVLFNFSKRKITEKIIEYNMGKH